MAFRKAWQKMKRTLPSETRKILVTRELWEIFLAKDQKDGHAPSTNILVTISIFK